ICLPYSQRIMTNHGYLPIGEIVTKRLSVKVWGQDEKSEKCGWQEIQEYERNPARPIYEIEFEQGKVRCTGDHPVFIEGRGYVRADSIRSGESLRTFRDDYLQAMRGA